MAQMTQMTQAVSKPVTFRVTGIFQYAENYAIHDWDGKGEVPQGWKMKGGVHVLLADGLTFDMICDEAFMKELSQRASSTHTICDDYVRQYFIGLDIELSSAPTYDEIVDAYCDWGIDLEEEEELGYQGEALDKYDSYTEQIGMLLA
jgi:hypothetical protein